MVDEVMGAGFSRALAEGTTSPVSKVVRKAGNFWSHFVDQPFRRAAFIHEARRYGFKTHDQMRSLIEDSGNRGLIGEVGQRARDAIVDYERLGPIERDIVRRVLFVYPWLKGSTYYATQFLRDHPIQAAVFAKIGEQGQAQSLEELGPLPSWAKGSFRVGGSEEQPLIVNPTAISPFSTPAQILASSRGSLGSVERSENVGEMASPVAQSAIEAAFGRELFTGRELEGGYPQKFGEQILKGLPQYQLFKRIREAGEAEGKAYPYGVGTAIGQFVGGSSSPRPANLEVLNEQATFAPKDPAQRAKEEVASEKQELAKLMQDVVGEKLPPRINRAFGRKQTVEVLRKTVDRQYAKQEEVEERNRAKFEGEIDILVKWGAMNPGEAKGAKAWSAKADLEDVRDARRYLVSHYFDDAYLQLLYDSRKYLEERQ